MIVPARRDIEFPPRLLFKENAMGLVYAELELINAVDLDEMHRGLMKPEEVRRVTVNALVDSGAYMTAIPESVREQLGLRIKRYESVEYAKGEVEKVPVTSPLEVHFANRETVSDAFVMGNEVLLGAIPMQAMDVLIDLKNERLIVNPANPLMPKIKMK